MPNEQVVSSRKRIPLGRYPTYEAALAAKKTNNQYALEQLQIRRKTDYFQLVARINVKETN
jgi:hypothetical protein